MNHATPLSIPWLHAVLRQPRPSDLRPHPRYSIKDASGRLTNRRHLVPPDARPNPAAVLLLFYPGPEGAMLVFTRRTAHLNKHAGQISFPGGRVDPTDPSNLATALRETREELGIATEALDLVMELSPIYIPPSNYLVSPFVMTADARPAFRPSPGEVEEVLEVPLAHLLRPETVESEWRELMDGRYQIPYFRVGSHKIWGATAAILGELVTILEASQAKDEPQ